MLHLSEGLPHVRALRELRLTDNPLGAEGGVHVLACLPPGACPALSALHVEGCDLGPEGAAHLARVLAAHPHVRTLCARGNMLQDAGAGRLAVGLSRAHGLRHLDLSSNMVGAQGGQWLAEPLPDCAELRHLELGG